MEWSVSLEVAVTGPLDAVVDKARPDNRSGHFSRGDGMRRRAVDTL